MTFKTLASTIGNGILDAGTAMHNATIDAQIDQIDAQMHTLREQLTRLENDRSDLVDRKI